MNDKEQITISKIFTYSEEEAKKNRNSVSMSKILLQSIILVMLMIVLPAMFDFGDNIYIIMISMIEVIIAIIIIIYNVIRLSIKMSARFMAIVTDTNNNLYIVGTKANVHPISSGASSGVEIVLKLIVLISSTNSINKSSKELQKIETITEAITESNSEHDLVIRQILKIHDYVQSSNKVVIKCDYKIMNTEKIYYNKRIVIHRSFNNFEELINIIINKK